MCEGGGGQREREKVGEREREGGREGEGGGGERELQCLVYILQVHQGCVDTYLEDIILQSVESTADQQARKEIRQQADSINKIAHDFEHTYVKLKIYEN